MDDQRLDRIITSLKEHHPWGQEVTGYLVRERTRQVESVVFRITLNLNDGEKHIFLKVYDSIDYLAGAAQREYQWLLEVSSLMGDSSPFSIVKPLAVLPDESALITEESPGRPLIALLKSTLNRLSCTKTARETSERYCYLAGQWLHQLHAASLPYGKIFDFRSLIEYVRPRLEEIRKLSNGTLSLRSIDKITAYLETTQHVLSDNKTQAVKIHGDFGPYNMLVADGRLLVMDPDLGHDYAVTDNFGSPYDDTAHFYHFLQSLSPVLFRRDTVKSVVQAFLSGVGAHIDPSDRLFKCFLIKCRVLFLLSLLTRSRRDIAKISRTKVFGLPSLHIRQFQAWFDDTCTL